MRDKLLCPFCGQELDYLSEDIYGSRVCPNCKCLGWVLHGNDSMWEELTTIKKKLDDLQKDYDLAVQHAKTMTETCLGYKAKLETAVDVLKELRPEEKKGCYLVPTVSTTQRIIDEALAEITALEQKEQQ